MYKSERTAKILAELTEAPAIQNRAHTEIRCCLKSGSACDLEVAELLSFRLYQNK
jgi:hypothetical protein